MNWISSTPPLWIWPNDRWVRRSDNKVFTASIVDRMWKGSEECVPFCKKTRVFEKDALSSIRDTHLCSEIM
jgi:hypothetical protein